MHRTNFQLRIAALKKCVVDDPIDGMFDEAGETHSR